MALNLINTDSSGVPTCKIQSDSSIDIGGIVSGQFGQKALPVASFAANTTTLLTSTVSWDVPFNSTSVRAFSGMSTGFTIVNVIQGAIRTPYDGVYRLSVQATMAANESTVYDPFTTYQVELRVSSSNIPFLMQLDMTDVTANPGGGSGTGGSADKTRSEEKFVYLPAGTNIRGLIKLISGTGGFSCAAFTGAIEYRGPATQTI